jgi:hypothetical protein
MRPGEPEGAVVVASDPLSDKPFPYGMPETIAHYADALDGR